MKVSTLKPNSLTLFIFLSFILLAFGYLSKQLLDTDELVINSLAEQLTQEQIGKLIESQKKWQWLGYAVIPLVILIRSSLVALCLSIGVFFCDIENRIEFNILFTDLKHYKNLT